MLYKSLENELHLTIPLDRNGIMSAFQVGEMVMATWSDGRKYPATVKAVLCGGK